jgi:hypothetical protein
MATYNWMQNPYFTPNGYAALSGSDTQGDGSANNPYRTIQKCIDTGKTLIQASHQVIREQWTGSPSIFFERGCIVDQFAGGELRGSIYGAKAINTRFGNNMTNAADSFIKGSTTGSGNTVSKTKLVLKNTAAATNPLQLATAGASWTNCTIVGHLVNLLSANLAVVYPNGFNRCIFDSCDITTSFNFSTSSDAFDFNLFFNCRFKFGTDTVFLTQAQLETTYGVTGIDAARAYYLAKYGTNNVFNYSRVGDPLFNNDEYDDYTLQLLSPARHMSYEGTFVGAKDIAFPTYAYGSDLGHPNAFYNASKNANTLVSNNSITLVRNPDGSAVGNGRITEKPKDLGRIYELKHNQCSYIAADRNREMLDANSDIDFSAPISAGTPLISGTVYVSEGGSSVYNGITYPNRSRITAVDNVQSFTTAEGAVYYAIREYPNRYTNYIRYKQTIPGAQIPAGTDVLTAGSWYRVFGNSITWDTKGIPVGDSFQAVAGKLSFTGSGVVVDEFSEADVYSEIIIDAPIKCRRIGNVSTGAIDTGTDGKPLTNGHKEYYNATNKARAEFSIFAKYTQKDWIMNKDMLK